MNDGEVRKETITLVDTLNKLPASAWESPLNEEHTCIFATVYAMSRTGKVIVTMNDMAQ